MDPKLTEVSQLFERFKADFIRNDFDTCSKLLSQLKVLLTEFRSLPPLFEETPNAVHELTIARDIYEHAVVLSVKIEDQDAFERDFFQLKPYYTDAQDEIAGCCEMAYDSLSINDVRKILLFSSDKELFEYVKEEHPEWDIKNGFVILKKAKESAACKEIPSLQLINQTLSYARELEWIV
ncbi:hypothetical protein CsSME_00050648 [Camellia sinensis var. sinensis]